MPDEISFVLKSPRCQHLQAFWQQSIGNPKVKMGGVGADAGDRKRANILKYHSAVAIQAFVLWRNLSGFVLELPWRISQYSGKPFTFSFFQQVL
ncbi:MAG: hypothetical protein A2Z95_02660 [Gallionellales bacterium GWA2_60_18]|nr:MAG: hypothetical protein A2Z95_02660 [Gallionellales bacterium GWA2_60_18]